MTIEMTSSMMEQHLRDCFVYDVWCSCLIEKREDFYKRGCSAIRDIVGADILCGLEQFMAQELKLDDVKDLNII